MFPPEERVLPAIGLLLRDVVGRIRRWAACNERKEAMMNDAAAHRLLLLLVVE
jgi:hypothetical protein